MSTPSLIIVLNKSLPLARVKLSAPLVVLPSVLCGCSLTCGIKGLSALLLAKGLPVPAVMVCINALLNFRSKVRTSVFFPLKI